MHRRREAAAEADREQPRPFLCVSCRRLRMLGNAAMCTHARRAHHTCTVHTAPCARWLFGSKPAPCPQTRTRAACPLLRFFCYSRGWGSGSLPGDVGVTVTVTRTVACSPTAQSGYATLSCRTTRVNITAAAVIDVAGRRSLLGWRCTAGGVPRPRPRTRTRPRPRPRTARARGLGPRCVDEEPPSGPCRHPLTVVLWPLANVCKRADARA